MNLPRNEKLWVTYVINGEDRFYETSNKDRSMYFLWDIETGKKIAKAQNPMDFRGYIPNTSESC